MPIYRAIRTRARTWSQDFDAGLDKARQFFVFEPFSRLASHMTIKRRVFVAIVEGKLELRVKRLRVRLGVLFVAFIFLLFICLFIIFIFFFFLLTARLEKS